MSDKVEKARAAVRECLSRDAGSLKGAGDFNGFNHARLSVEAAIGGRDIAELVAQAETDPAAWDACFSLLGTDGEKPPQIKELLARFIRGEAKPPRGKGQSIQNKDWRDLRIALAVQSANAKGLPAYSDGESTAVTACDVVAEILPEFGLALTVERVKKIWKSYPREMRGGSK